MIIKKVIALAQTYFAVQTQQQELTEIDLLPNFSLQLLLQQKTCHRNDKS